ncbi:MAG: MBOAT family protein, partial [Firmicutes bacterium]|nr:MBOAT family protein [Bacillota bacterium]
MVFSSIYFLFIFLPVVLLLYFTAPPRLRNIILLIASIFFYAWGEPIYVFLMLLSIIINYVMGIDIARSETEGRKKRNLFFAVAINILILGFFKYYGFCLDIVNSITPLDLEYRELPLPIGISFYTFQALSYIIDVYKGKVEPQKNIISFAVFISMFPQLVAGPIVKYTDIEDKLKERDLNRTDIAQGIERLVMGLAKKVGLGFQHVVAQQGAQAASETGGLFGCHFILLSGCQ